MRYRLLLALFAPLSTLSAQSLEVESYRLDNGLTVILYEDHSAPQACVNLWYGVGSKDEREGRSGFAHLFEHLMFMGTERVGEGQFDVIMETGGGFNNATTSTDRTNYFDFGPSELLPTLLWLEADRLEGLPSAMTAEKLELQRQVVLNERRQRVENAPYGEAMPRSLELLHPPGHPYHHSTIGSPEDLLAATVEDVVDFFDAYYVPNNASLVVAGDFDSAQIRPLIESLFGSLDRGAAPAHRTAEPPRLSEEVRATLYDDVRFARVDLAYPSPARFAPGDAEMDLVASLLGDGLNSRLYQRLVVELGVAQEVQVYQWSRSLGSQFMVSALASPTGEPAVVEREIDAVLADFLKVGPSAAELERQKMLFELSFLRGLESLLERADLLNAYQFAFGAPNSFARDLGRYRNATVESVLGAARASLQPDQRVVMHILPETASSANPRDEQPEIAAAAPFQTQMPQSAELGSGIELMHWPRTDLPLANVVFVFDSGAASDPQGRAGLAYLVGEMLDEGALNPDGAAQTAGDFQARLESLGAELNVTVGREDTRIALTVLERNLDAAFDLVADAIRRPLFLDADWERVHGLHGQGLIASQDDPSSVARRALRRVFFGGSHAYGWPTSGTPSSVQSLQASHARTFHGQHYRPSLLTILSAGAAPIARIQRLAEQAFGDWAEASQTVSATVSYPELEQQPLRVALIDRPGAVQTIVSFAMPAPAHADGKRVARELLGTLLGGSFTSRLNANLREKNGYTYGARSRFDSDPQVGWFTASAAVRADVTGAAVTEFLNEFKRLRAGDVTPAEAEKARAVRRTALISTQSSSARLLNWAADRLLFGEDWAQLGTELQQLSAVTSDELNALADAAFPLEQGVLLLVGDERLIREELSALELPEPVTVAISGEAIPRRMR